ncbi:MAG: hypothetical protein IID41_00585 [Planctomycetes bacterium]|nr:hypothetical protein [Planctomycetota bacterium]
MYTPLKDSEMFQLGTYKGTLGAKAAAAIRNLTDRVAELQIAIAQDDKSGECATYEAGQNAAEIRELRRQNNQWQDELDSWKLLSVKQVQEIIDLKLANERLKTEIRELQHEVELHDSRVEYQLRMRAGEQADNARLQEKLKKCGRHEYGCAAIGAHRVPGTPCNCGLADEPKEPDAQQAEA